MEVDGISVNGLFANSEKEAAITLAMAGQSACSYFLCDAGKIEKESYLEFAEPGLMDTFITDCERSLVRYLRKCGVKFIGVRK